MAKPLNAASRIAVRRARYGSISKDERWLGFWFILRMSFKRPSLVLRATKSLANLSIKSRLAHLGSVSSSEST